MGDPSSRSRFARLWHGPSVHTHHAIDYIELSVTDLDAAKRFYAEAFGWSFNDYGPGYAGIQGPQREVGGLARVEEVTRGGPLVILFSEDLEGSVDAVKRAGGTIVKEPFSFPGGQRFHFADPSGNELAVWAPSEG
ncbi:MAG: VOC family protein [Myxococcota bacterium]